MKIYQFKRTQILPITLNEAWDFFSNPQNLSQITPARMNFRILCNSGTSMYTGQTIQYKVNVLPGYTVDWLTEITRVDKPFHFIDEQRVGPYDFWHHEHYFKEVRGGVEVTDKVNYAIPLGLIGRLANRLFVQRELAAIFNYRYAVLQKHFGKIDQEQTISA